MNSHLSITIQWAGPAPVAATSGSFAAPVSPDYVLGGSALHDPKHDGESRKRWTDPTANSVLMLFRMSSTQPGSRLTHPDRRRGARWQRIHRPANGAAHSSFDSHRQRVAVVTQRLI
jgi:hypothetical protein